MRVGIGYDVHRLGPGRPLTLGGIEVVFDKGLLGWSDGDVLLHAIIDALLGAAAMGDIGTHFPTGDPQYRGISSVLLLERTRSLLAGQGWHIGNLDSTVVAQQPRLAPYVSQMRRCIAQRLGVDESQVQVKAKTTDGLGFTGQGRGIAAYAVALLIKKQESAESGY